MRAGRGDTSATATGSAGAGAERGRAQRGGGRRARGREEQSGRGLLIVGELASRWGREDGAGRRTVWFELDW